MPSPFLTAGQAAGALGVTKPTLYAYTSRGQLRSDPVPGRPRERRYHREDVERLKVRRDARRDPARAVARGLHWGGPVLDSAITLIQNGRYYYRGHDAVHLAARSTLEDVSGLLWGADAFERTAAGARPVPITPRQLAALRSLSTDPVARFQAVLPIAAVSDLAARDLSPAAVRRTGARILRLLTAVVSHRHPRDREPVHRSLQASWAPRRGTVAEVIRTALVLCADHELNVSAFTARCAASAAASPYDVVSAAMATLKGYRHGGAAARVLELLDRADTYRTARAAMAEWLQRGERAPGFGHPLYPAGDPRAALLMQIADDSGNHDARMRLRHMRRAGAELHDDRPNLDFGLAAVTRAYDLPIDAPIVLFALGRTVGWIAHAMEEYASGELIRPRARYTGPVPTEVSTFKSQVSRLKPEA